MSMAQTQEIGDFYAVPGSVIDMASPEHR